MARTGGKGRGARAALPLLCAVLHVAGQAQAPPPVGPAVNWASSAAYGATAVASNAGYWVRPAERDTPAPAALSSESRFPLSSHAGRRGTRRSPGTRWTAIRRRSGPAPAARCALHLRLPPAQGHSARGPGWATAVRPRDPRARCLPRSLLRSSAPRARAQVCCSESRPAWLLVSLGAVRPLAALVLMHVQDMTYTLSLGNASDGPFLQVARKTCTYCVMNQDLGGSSDLSSTEEASHRTSPQLPRRIFQLAPSASAAFVQVVITWSSGGGVGGCNDRACLRCRSRVVASLC